MTGIIILPIIFIGLFIWDCFWLSKVFEPTETPYPVTLSSIPDPF